MLMNLMMVRHHRRKMSRRKAVLQNEILIDLITWPASDGHIWTPRERKIHDAVGLLTANSFIHQFVMEFLVEFDCLIKCE